MRLIKCAVYMQNCAKAGGNAVRSVITVCLAHMYVEDRSPPPTVSRVWVAAVSAARRVWLRRALLVARVSNDYPSGS